jgi:hypothetical protein
LCVLPLITVVGCGTSRSHSQPTTTTTTTATPPSTAQLTQIVSPTTSETATGTPPAGTETTTNPGAPANGGAPPENARIPATFTIAPGGSLNPPTITAPAHLPVQVTVISGDGRAHKAVLHTPTMYVLAVPARGRASVLIADLKVGRYALDIDGTPRGALVIGGAPGP